MSNVRSTGEAEPVSIAEQIAEVELLALGQASWLERADKKEFETTPTAIERRRVIYRATQAAIETLRWAERNKESFLQWKAAGRREEQGSLLP